jgi:alkyldihydroxyacetonephosphate synthase
MRALLASTGGAAGDLRRRRGRSRPGSPAARPRLHARPLPAILRIFDLGGWVVTRSSGQQSLRYGRIEQLFAGGSVETPAGTLAIPTFPASAAGTDLREMVLGSEGRLGILTEATVRISRLPPYEAFHAVFFPDWERPNGPCALSCRPACRCRCCACRTRWKRSTMLALAGHKRQVALLEAWLRCAAAGSGKCMLLVGASGDAKGQARAACGPRWRWRAAHGGVHAGRGWASAGSEPLPQCLPAQQRLAHGYAIDTVETAVDWPRVTPAMRAIEDGRAARAGAQGERVHAYTHLSHLYAQGASVYTTFVYRLAGDYEATWRAGAALKTRGVGGDRRQRRHHQPPARRRPDHAPWLEAEKGALGMARCARCSATSIRTAA